MIVALKTRRRSPDPGVEGFQQLLDVCRPLKFEPHDIAPHLDSRGHDQVDLDREFPLLLKLFHYTSKQHTRGPTWHERLELFLPLDGPVLFRMGKADVHLAAGEMLIVDNLRLHHVVDFPGFDTRVIVLSFMQGLVYSLGSPSIDFTFLLPFYSRLEAHQRVLRTTAPGAGEVYRALGRLMRCYFADEPCESYRAGCKAYLLELLFELARQFRDVQILQWELVRQQHLADQLKPLFLHITERCAERLTISQAAAMVHMSRPRFMRTFKRVAGMTFLAYHNHVRLSQALTVLRQSHESLADIASRLGFADQSHFNRRFKAAFGQSPQDYRLGRRPEAR